MLVAVIHIHVKPEHVDDFKRASVENATQSIQEPGIARFDIVQQANDPTRFVFIEVYRDVDATTAHKNTTHYATWRDAVVEMMAEPRSRAEYKDVFWTDAV